MPLLSTIGSATSKAWGFANGVLAKLDPYFNYVTLLLNGDGTNGAQNNTFLDSSTNNFTITRNGNTTQGSFSPYGNLWSNYFDGSSIYVPANASFGFGTGDYTIEFWVNTNATSDQTLVSMLGSSTTQAVPHLYLGSGAVIFYFNGANAITGSVLTVGQWYHIALSRSSGSTKMFMNGTQVGSTYSDSNNYLSPAPVRVADYGTSPSGVKTLNGNVSNLRIVKGTALYTANFTPSTTPLTAISGTSLLTCQSSNFVDNSTNNFAITPNGSPSVQRFSPFNPTAPYSTSVIGGSGYFNPATSDGLTTPSTGQFAPTGDFTVGLWYYPNVFDSFNEILGNYTSGVSTDWLFEIASGTLRAYTNGATIRITSTALVVKQWNYIALCRSGSTITLYVNGVSQGTYTQSGTFGSATQTIYVGCQSGFTYSADGYLSDVKLIDGTVITTIPTAPQTVTTGTKLLLSFTNAGIPDLAMQNNLETVGSAQVSTSVKKYGTGSLAFDGTGDYLFREYSPNFNFGTGSFTIEMWVYPLSVTSTIRGLFAVSGGSGGNPKFVVHLNSGTPDVHYNNLTNGSNIYTAATSSISANTWTHIAFVRNGSTWYWFINGVQSGTGSNSTNITFTSQPSYVGYGGEGYFDTFNGYIDDLRITNGYARYTANFTPPTQALPTY